MRHLPVLVLLLALNACSEPGSVEISRDQSAVVTEWRVVIQLPEAQVPVHMHLAPDGSEAWFSNGAERVRVPEVRAESDGWTLRFPAFNNTVRLRKTDEGFEGDLTLVKRGYEQVMELEALPYEGFRFVDNAQPNTDVDVTGRWEVTFVEDDGAESFAVGEFDQQGAVVTGTFLTAKGDYRYLAGEVEGRIMHLSTFDGAHAFTFSATLAEDGSLEGDFWSGTRWHESWTARKNFDAKLPDAFSLTFLKEGYDRLDFTFPDLEGRPVSLSDDKYAGKVVLVTLSGSWCPNCADEAEFLSGYFRDNRARGLEIITLLYEHTDDFESAAALGRALRDKHGIGFDVLVAGSSDKTEAAESLPMLNHVLAYPTLIFVDRTGAVRGIHTGFSGPGTGYYFEEFKREFEARMEALLAE